MQEQQLVTDAEVDQPTDEEHIISENPTMEPVVVNPEITVDPEEPLVEED